MLPEKNNAADQPCKFAVFSGHFRGCRSSSGSILSDHLSVHPQPLGCLVCVICYSKSFHSFVFKLYNDCSHNENVHFLFCAHFMNIFSFLGVLNFSSYPSKMLRWHLVCVICNSNSFHTFIFKLCIMIVHTLKMCTSLIFYYIFGSVELRHHLYFDNAGSAEFGLVKLLSVEYGEFP